PWAELNAQRKFVTEVGERQHGKRMTMDTKGKVFKTLAGASAAIAILGLSGCLRTPDRSAGRVLYDKMITSKVKGALDVSPVYKYDDVKVATYKGVVQLSGFVDTEDQRRK